MELSDEELGLAPAKPVAKPVAELSDEDLGLAPAKQELTDAEVLKPAAPQQMRGVGGGVRQLGQSLDKDTPAVPYLESLGNALGRSWNGKDMSLANREFYGLIATKHKLERELADLDPNKVPDRNPILDQVYNPAAGGLFSTTQQDPISEVQSKKFALADIDKRLQEIIPQRDELEKAMDRNAGQSEAYKQFQEANSKDDLAGSMAAMFGNYGRNFIDIGTQAAAESFIPTVKSLAIDVAKAGATALSGGTLAPVIYGGSALAQGGVAARDATVGNQDQNFQEFLKKKGIDAKDEPAVIAYAKSNPREYLEAWNLAQTTGLAAGGAEGLVTGAASALPGAGAIKTNLKNPVFKFAIEKGVPKLIEAAKEGGEEAVVSIFSQIADILAGSGKKFSVVQPVTAFSQGASAGGVSGAVVDTASAARKAAFGADAPAPAPAAPGSPPASIVPGAGVVPPAAPASAPVVPTPAPAVAPTAATPPVAPAPVAPAPVAPAPVAPAPVAPGPAAVPPTNEETPATPVAPAPVPVAPVAEAAPQAAPPPATEATPATPVEPTAAANPAPAVAPPSPQPTPAKGANRATFDHEADPRWPDLDRAQQSQIRQVANQRDNRTRTRDRNSRLGHSTKQDEIAIGKLNDRIEAILTTSQPKPVAEPRPPRVEAPVAPAPVAEPTPKPEPSGIATARKEASTLKEQIEKLESAGQGRTPQAAKLRRQFNLRKDDITAYEKKNKQPLSYPPQERRTAVDVEAQPELPVQPEAAPVAEAKPVAATPVAEEAAPAAPADNTDVGLVRNEGFTPDEVSALKDLGLKSMKERLAGLEASGKGDSKDAQSLRQTIAMREKSSQAKPAQTEIAGTDDNFNLTGEQASAPKETTNDTTGDLLPDVRDNPLLTEARNQLTKLEDAGRGDSDQAASLRKQVAELSQSTPASEPADATPEKKPKQKVFTAREGEQPSAPRRVDRERSNFDEAPEVQKARRIVAEHEASGKKRMGKRVSDALTVIDQWENDNKLKANDPTTDVTQVSDEALQEAFNQATARKEYNESEGVEGDKAQAQLDDKVMGEHNDRFNKDDTGTTGDFRRDLLNLTRRMKLPYLPKVFGATSLDTLREQLDGMGISFNRFAQPKGASKEMAAIDGDHRTAMRESADKMIERISESLAEMGWTQLDPTTESYYDAFEKLVQDTAAGKPTVPKGGVMGAAPAERPSTKRMYTPTIDSKEVATVAGEKASEAMRKIEAELKAAVESGASPETISEKMDAWAKETLPGGQLLSVGPNHFAAMVWQAARQTQQALGNFAQWSKNMVHTYGPKVKPFLKQIWADSQQVRRNVYDIVTVRYLSSRADKMWQNVSRYPNSPTMRKLANLLSPRDGAGATGEQTAVQRRIREESTKFANGWANILQSFGTDFVGMSKDQRRQWDEDFRDYVLGNKTPTDPKMVKAVDQYRQLMGELLGFQRDAGVEMGDRGGNYFPRVPNSDAVAADLPGFITAAAEMYRQRDVRLGNPAKTTAEYEKMAGDRAFRIQNGNIDAVQLNSTAIPDQSDTPSSTKPREFTDDENELIAKFMSKDIDRVTLAYIARSVKAAEIARAFGPKGEKFTAMIASLQKEGVPMDVITETAVRVRKTLGYGVERHGKLAASALDWGNTVVAAGFLGASFINNLLLEPVSYGIRTGNPYLGLKALAMTWAGTIRVLSRPSEGMNARIEKAFGTRVGMAKSFNEAMAEQLGLLQNEVERSFIDAHWNYTEENGSPLARWVIQRVQQANLMHQTEAAKVAASVGIARLALRDNVRFMRGEAPLQKFFQKIGINATAPGSTRLILKENGVPEAERQAFADFVMSLDGKSDADYQAAVMANSREAFLYRQAVQRMSNGMSIKTDSALKMDSADTTEGKLIMTLMNYSYAYANLVKDAMYSKALKAVNPRERISMLDRGRLAVPVLVGATLSVLAAEAGKALVNALMPTEGTEKRDEMDDWMKLLDSASYAGLFGKKFEFLAKAVARKQMPVGPILDSGIKTAAAGYAAVHDLTVDGEEPGRTAQKQLFNTGTKPVLVGGAAAVHPFLGFMVNQAMRQEDVRNEFIGEKTR